VFSPVILTTRTLSYAAATAIGQLVQRKGGGSGQGEGATRILFTTFFMSVPPIVVINAF